MDERSAVLALAALAQGMRLRIFRALVGAGPEGLTPGVLASVLDVSASTLSFHLRELMHAGLVTQQRQGRHLIYRPALMHMNGLLAYLVAHCCGGQPCAVTPAPRRPTACVSEAPAAPDHLFPHTDTRVDRDEP